MHPWLWPAPTSLTLVIVVGVGLLVVVAVCVGMSMDTQVQRREWARVAQARRQLRRSAARCPQCPYRDDVA